MILYMRRHQADYIYGEFISRSTSQPTLEHCTKKSKEAKEIVDDHVADFFYENAIAFNVINSRSFEIMVESIGQYGPGYRAPTFREIREELLDRLWQRGAHGPATACQAAPGKR